jgi:hypothetical protein
MSDILLIIHVYRRGRLALAESRWCESVEEAEAIAVRQAKHYRAQNHSIWWSATRDGEEQAGSRSILKARSASR